MSLKGGKLRKIRHRKEVNKKNLKWKGETLPGLDFIVPDIYSMPKISPSWGLAKKKNSLYLSLSWLSDTVGQGSANLSFCKGPDSEYGELASSEVACMRPQTVQKWMVGAVFQQNFVYESWLRGWFDLWPMFVEPQSLWYPCCDIASSE